MRYGFDRSVIFGIGSLASLMVAIAATSYVNTLRLRDSADQVARRRNVIDKIHAVQFDTVRLQADLRVYLVTGFAEAIKPYEESSSRLRADAGGLAKELSGDEEHRPHVLAAAREIEEGIAGFDSAVKLRGGPDGPAAINALSRQRGTRSFVDPLIETLGIMDRIERERLAKREAATQSAFGDAILYEVAAAVLGLVAVLMFVRLLARSTRIRTRDTERLAEQRELLEATLTSIGDAVIATDVEGCVTFLNPIAERLTGWPQIEAKGVPIERVFHIVNESSRTPVDNPTIRVLREGIIVGLANHTVLIARDGTEFPIDDSAAPIRSRGTVSGAVLVFRDITEKKRAEEAVEEKGRIAALGAEIGFALTRGSSLRVALDECAKALVAHAGAAFARFWTLNESENVLELQASAGMYTHLDGPHARVPVGKFKIGLIAQERKPQLTNAVIGDPRVGEQEWARREGLVSFAGYPLIVADELVGVMAMFAKRPLSPGTLQAMTTVANEMAVGISRTRTEEERERLLQEIDLERDRLADVFQHAPSFMGVLRGPDHVFERANDRYDRLVCGRPLIGLPVRDALPEVVGQGYIELLDRVYRTGEAHVDTDARITIEQAGGLPPEERCLDFVYQPMRDATGSVRGILVHGVDLTERKRAEEALRESEERLQVAIAAAKLGQWTLDLRSKALNCSDGCKANYGRSPSTPFSYEDLWSSVHEEDVDRVRTAVQASVENRVDCDTEYRTTWPDGSTHWVMVRGRTSYASDGSPVAMTGVTLDITDRKAAEHREQRRAREAVAASEAVRFLSDASASLAELVDYESTLQRIAKLAVGKFADWCVVDILDENGKRRRLAANGVEAALSASPDAGETADGVPHVLRTGEPELVSDVAALDMKTASQGADRIGQLLGWGINSYLAVPLLSRGRVIGGITFLSAGGRRRYGQQEMLIAKELAVRVTTAIENATLYRTLQDQDRRKDEFLATLAHELRNPLAPVRNGVQILRASLQPDERADRALSMMERQLGQMVHLVDDLMDVARVSSGKVALRKERLDLRAVVDSSVESSRPVVESGGHELSVEIPAEPVILEADKTRLVQVLVNLLGNAAKYTPHGGHIVLSVHRTNGNAEVRVTDTGVGIAPEMLPKVFEMFTQVGTSLERSQGGLGIGLTLVRRLVEMHGGTVTAESAGPGKGSTFTVRLPLSGILRQQGDVAIQHEVRPVANIRILVVDDNLDAAESLSMLLEIKGHEVKAVHDGPEALRAFGSYRPHLVLLDIGLPGMSGYEVAHRIRASPDLGGVILAALTGWGQEEDRRRTREAGFDYHLTKPADLKVLEEILAAVGRAVSPLIP